MENSNSSVKVNKMAKKTAPATAPAVETTPAPAKATKAPKPSKAEVSVPVVAAAPAVVAAPAETAAADVGTAESRLQAVAESFRTLISDLSTRGREALKALAEAGKQARREVKDSKKKKRKNPADMTPEELKTYEARRANNAFLKPRPLSPELCSFLGLPAHSSKSQTDVTKAIATYVKTNGCFDPSNKRIIVPNAALAKLLKPKDGQQVTYLTLQTFLKSHYVKTA
jgi:chromatin remodeling complex protein RSC6